MGISNTPLIDLFLSFGVKVTVADLTEKEEMKDIISSYRAKGVHFQLGKDYLSDLSYDVIFKRRVCVMIRKNWSGQERQEPL